MTNRRYVTASRIAELQAQLSGRDLAVIDTLASLGVATSGQLERAHFAGVSARHRRRALARLHALGVLARLTRRVGGPNGGSCGYVYALDIAGQRLARTIGAAAGRRRPRRPGTPPLATLGHALAVTELYVQLVELTRRRVCELAAFDAEPDCWRAYLGAYGQTVTLKPDAFVIVHTGGYELRSFIEADRATQSPATLRAKMQAYRRYWASGREQAAHGVFPLVLFLVPDQPRAALVAALIAELPTHHPRLYQVRLLDQAASAFTTDNIDFSQQA